MFWLDAHHSLGKTGHGAKLTPVSEEVEAILAHAVDGHVVAIDDIRSFTGRGDYPSLEELTARLKAVKPHYDTLVRYDILTFAPRGILERMRETPFRMHAMPLVAR